MKNTPQASAWLDKMRKLTDQQTLHTIISCAMAIAKSRHANRLGRNHLERALRWLVIGE